VVQAWYSGHAGISVTISENSLPCPLTSNYLSARSARRGRSILIVDLLTSLGALGLTFNPSGHVLNLAFNLSLIHHTSPPTKFALLCRTINSGAGRRHDLRPARVFFRESDASRASMFLQLSIGIERLITDFASSLRHCGLLDCFVRSTQESDGTRDFGGFDLQG